MITSNSITDNRVLYATRDSCSDICLVIGTNKIPVHKNILISTSDYFRAMFTIEMLESQLQEVTIDEYLIREFLLVLRVAYGFKLTVPELDKDWSFSELFDAIVISNKYNFLAVEEIISEMFVQKLMTTPISYLCIKYNNYTTGVVDNNNSAVSDTTVLTKVTENESLQTMTIYELMDVARDFNLLYLPQFCQQYIQTRALQNINSFKYYYNLWS
ncbi:kelch-like protein 26 [Oppia nitens]|uniref:kelch-like protein 26 n=1 Tax=Oppia nitens TaxID=1686743 RepID=UPI0023DA3F30|nr:kelch-like protein 26 [Oppia nitens]